MVAQAFVDIDASAERVWNILVDLDRYGEWNPFVYRIKGRAEVGQPVTLYVRLSGFKVKQRLVVREVEAPARLKWTLPSEEGAFLRGGRTQTVEDLGGGRCRYTSREELIGWASPLVGLLTKGPIQRGMEAGAVALKIRAEAG